MSGSRLLTTAFAAAAIILSGCSSTTAGTPVTSSVRAGELPSVMSSTVTTTSAAPAGNSMDHLVLQYVQGASAWWQQQGVDVGTIDVESFTSDIPCNKKTAHDDAIFCHHHSGGGTLKYRSDRFAEMQSSGGDLAVELTVSHEVGHAVQFARNARYSDSQPTLVELSADCFAGAYVGSEGVEQTDAKAALPPTGLLVIPGAADAVAYGIVSYAMGERGDELVNHCLKYKPIR